MNKIYISFLAIVLVFLSSSCDNFLEIDPEAEIPADQALLSGANVESTLAAAYNQVASGDFLGGRTKLYATFMSDNFQPLQPVDPTDFTGQVISRNTNSVNVDIDNLWSTAYRAIARANAVIDAVDNNTVIDQTPQSNLNQWKGEALFIRAISHFETLRLFAHPYSKNPTSDLGIPIRLKALEVDEKLPRATVAEVYTQVIADLQAALDLLPGENGNRADQVKAKAYLARVYFNQLDYDNAFTMAKDVIDNSGIDLGGNVFTPFRNVGNVTPQGGVVFQIITNFNPFGGFRPGSNNYGISTELSSLLVARSNDSRSSMVVGGRFTNKWDANVLNLPLIRISEMYLILAESALLKSTLDNAEAQDAYNTLRRFYAVDEALYMDTTLTGNDLVQAIREERRIELHIEGDRLHELKRLQATDFGAIPDVREAVSYDESELLLQIPFSETSGNPAIVQN